jgi:hypothetical protein
MDKKTRILWINLACRVVTVITLCFVFSKLLPLDWLTYYEYDLGLLSPDGKYKIAVLRGDRSAITDFSYRVYVFPARTLPIEPAKNEEVVLTGIWADERYLVYSGYAIPSLRWTSSHEVEIDLDDLYDEVDQFNPAPKMEPPWRDSFSAILVSLVLNKKDNRNVMP